MVCKAAHSGRCWHVKDLQRSTCFTEGVAASSCFTASTARQQSQHRFVVNSRMFVGKFTLDSRLRTVQLNTLYQVTYHTLRIEFCLRTAAPQAARLSARTR